MNIFDKDKRERQAALDAHEAQLNQKMEESEAQKVTEKRSGNTVSLDYYFKKNLQPADEVLEVQPSERLTDQNGQPVSWMFSSLSARQYEALRKKHLKRTFEPEAKQFIYDMEDGWSDEVFNIALLEPNLHDPALLEDYGVKTAAELAQEILRPGEYSALIDQLFESFGFRKEEKDKEKNSNG